MKSPDRGASIEKAARVATGLTPLDEVLGGGLGRGGTTLLVGPRGVGRSTLGLQVINVAGGLFASAEMRRGEIEALAVRLGFHNVSHEQILETDDVRVVRARSRAARIHLVVVDSIHVMRDATLSGEVGRTQQLRAVFNRLDEFAYATEAAVLLIVDEKATGAPHAVQSVIDGASTTLHLQPTADQNLRTIWTDKNRFAPIGQTIVEFGAHGFAPRSDL